MTFNLLAPWGHSPERASSYLIELLPAFTGAARQLLSRPRQSEIHGRLHRLRRVARAKRRVRCNELWGGTIEGGFVDLRGRPWLVEEVRGEANDLQTLNLSCISDDVQGERLEILWDAEIGAIVLDEDGSSSPSTSQKSQ